MHPAAKGTDDPVQVARALAPRIRALADDGERQRRLPAELVEAFIDAGIFRLCVPRALGGIEVDPATFVRTLEVLSAADGAAGWCAMIGATSGVVSAYLAPEVARELFGDPRTVAGGAFAPKGKVAPTDGGWRLTGRWPFASGCQHCTWLMGGALVPRDGRPELRLLLFPAGQARILDTWTVSGLAGTGSHDIAVDDLFIPASHTVSLVTERPHATGPLYAFPVFGLLALGIAGVALGIARTAVDELIALAGGKTPALARAPLAARAVVQAQLAEAEAMLRAARAHVFDAIGDAWQAATGAGTITVAHRAGLRLASTHAARSAAATVDRMYDAGGGTSIYATSLLQRCFRDVHALTQHVLVGAPTLELVGRVLLGVDTDLSML